MYFTSVLKVQSKHQKSEIISVILVLKLIIL